MLDLLRKWFSPSADGPQGEWRDLAAWAEARHWQFRHVRNVQGIVIDGRLGPTAWRLEWGPSQRSYVRGQELRLRATLNVAPDLQALVLSRKLQEAMEKDVFDQYVEGVQTRVDTRTPPEMRWLVMYPMLGSSDMKPLREHWSAVSNVKPWIERWLNGALTSDLATLGREVTVPVVLMVTRGQLTLRTELPSLDLASVEKWLHLFETAVREAQRVAADFADIASPSTQPSLWEASAMPGDSRALAH